MKAKINKSKAPSKSAFRRVVDERCDPATPARRSIPVGEVNQMIHNAINRVKAEATIYDDRARILEQIESNEGEIAYLESRLHGMRLNSKTIRNDLAQVNLAITRQLELDEV